MKKNKRIIIFLLLALFFNSCNDFLVEEPRAKLSPESFYKNLEDIKIATKGIYVPLYNNVVSMPGNHRSFQMHMAADDLTTHPASNKSQWRYVDQFNILPVTTFIERTGWQIPYQVIQQCNAIIEAKDAGTVVGDQDEINKYVAIAYFFRGWSHFYISRFYKDIPLILSTKVDYELTKTPVLEVYQQIEKDFKEAEKYLPATWAEKNYPNIWALKTLMADFYLTWAGWPIKDESKYAIAAQYAKDVMNNSGAELLEDFADLWKYDPYGTYDNHKENIWSFIYSTNEQVGTNARARKIGRNFIPENEKKGWSDFFCEIGFFNRFPDNYRKQVTFKTEIINGNDTIPWTQFTTKHPYYAKYRGNYDYGGTNDRNSGDDFEMYRFADVLLIYAEAQAMANGPDASTYEAINKVRRRANKLDINTPNAEVDLQPGLSKTEFRDAVIDEKGWEFAAEQRRWFDLTRTEKVEWAMSLKDPLDLQPLNPVNKDRYLFPIPYNDVLMNPNLSQNPGY